MEKNKERKKRGYYQIIEHCIEAAKSCSSRTEFIEKYPQAYINLKTNGLIDEYIPSERRERTYERFMNIAKQCNTKKEVTEMDASIAAKAQEEGWYKDCPWIPEISCGPRKWSDEKRLEAALKCNTRKEYEVRFNGAYTYDRKNNLLDRYTHFIKPVPHGRNPDAKDYSIYVYSDDENKVVYVGLTYEARKEKRDKEHRYGRRDKNGTIVFDAVGKYWHSIGKQMPVPKYLVENIHLNEAGYYEDYFINKYRQDGWTILNIAKAGSLGGAKIKWTYEATFDEAKKYDTRNNFKKGNSPAYYKALRTKNEQGIPWIDTFYWLRDSSEVRSEAGKKVPRKPLSEKHKNKISEGVKNYYANKKPIDH